MKKNIKGLNYKLLKNIVLSSSLSICAACNHENTSSKDETKPTHDDNNDQKILTKPQENTTEKIDPSKNVGDTNNNPDPQIKPSTTSDETKLERKPNIESVNRNPNTQTPPSTTGGGSDTRDEIDKQIDEFCEQLLQTENLIDFNTKAEEIINKLNESGENLFKTKWNSGKSEEVLKRLNINFSEAKGNPTINWDRNVCQYQTTIFDSFIKMLDSLKILFPRIQCNIPWLDFCFDDDDKLLDFHISYPEFSDQNKKFNLYAGDNGLPVVGFDRKWCEKKSGKISDVKQLNNFINWIKEKKKESGNNVLNYLENLFKTCSTGLAQNNNNLFLIFSSKDKKETEPLFIYFCKLNEFNSFESFLDNIMLENIINITSLKDSFSVSLSNFYLNVKLKFIDNKDFIFSKKNDYLLLNFLRQYKNFFNKSIDFQKCFHIDIQDSWITGSFYAGTSHSSNKIPFKKISINILDDILSSLQLNSFSKWQDFFYNCSSSVNLQGENFAINYKSLLKLAYLVNNGFVNLGDTFDNVKWSESFGNDSCKNPSYVVFFDLNNNKKLRVDCCTEDILQKFDKDGKSFFISLIENSKVSFVN